jgi:hypothetical protein
LLEKREHFVIYSRFPNRSEWVMPSKNDNKPVECEHFTFSSRVPSHCLLLNCYNVAKRGTARNVIMFAMREQENVQIKVAPSVLTCTHAYTRMLAACTWSTILTEFAAMIEKSSIFWDITPCSQLKVNRRFGRICHHHIQSRKIGPVRNQRECKWPQVGFLLGLFFDPEDGGDIFPRNISRLSTGYTVLYLRR